MPKQQAVNVGPRAQAGRNHDRKVRPCAENATNSIPTAPLTTTSTGCVRQFATTSGSSSTSRMTSTRTRTRSACIRLGLPELLATGVTTERALALFDYFVPESIQDGTPAPGDQIVLGEGAVFEAVEVDHPDAHMDLGVKLFGPKLRAVQLVWTDGYGRWPWDAEFSYRGIRQPVLGRPRSERVAVVLRHVAQRRRHRHHTGHHAVVPREAAERRRVER